MSHTILRFSFGAVRRSTVVARSIRSFADGAASAPPRPVRGTGISREQRAALRAARKERASKVLAQQKGDGASSTGATTSTASSMSRTSLAMSRWIWYLAVGVPSALLIWGFSDENSAPAKFCQMIGLTDFVRGYTDEIAKPAHKKLLPDWSQVPFHMLRIIAV